MEITWRRNIGREMTVSQVVGPLPCYQIAVAVQVLNVQNTMNHYFNKKHSYDLMPKIQSFLMK